MPSSLTSRPPMSPRNYHKPWLARGKSPRQARTLTSKELWTSNPNKWQNKPGTHFCANFPPPQRHSEIGGHHEMQVRPQSRGCYHQPKYGHVIPFKSTSRPSTSMSLKSKQSKRSSTPQSDLSCGMAFGSDDESDDDDEDNDDNISNGPAIPTTTEELNRTREPGRSVILRRPPSPFKPYSERTSEERQKIALVKLRGLYDGRQQFHQIFTMWDIDRDGGIDVNEFQTQLHHHGFHWLTNDDVEGLFHRFVPEDRHSLNFVAFRDFMFAHAVNDTKWDSSFNPFTTDKNHGWKSPRLARHKKKFKVTNPNPWRKNSNNKTNQDPEEEYKSFVPPLVSPLRRPPPVQLPPQLQDILCEHGNKLMKALKRLNGGRRDVGGPQIANILTNLRQRQGVPLYSSDMPALANYLSLNNGRRVPYHQVIGRLRQAQRQSSLRQRWSDDEKFRRNVVHRSLGFVRPGTPRLGYGAAGNTNLMESRNLFEGRTYDGNLTPRHDSNSRPSTAASTARRSEFMRSKKLGL